MTKAKHEFSQYELAVIQCALTDYGIANRETQAETAFRLEKLFGDAANATLNTSNFTR